jgi:hypothetical protein
MTQTRNTQAALRTLAIWGEVEAILDRPPVETNADQLAIFADPTTPPTLFDVDAPDWTHERTAQ